MSTFPADPASETRPRLAGEYDALADLFLGGDAGPSVAQHATPSLRLVNDAPPTPPASPPAPRAPASIEAVLLGSLPIYASAWVSQFVRTEAQRLDAPVALVRTLAGEGSVDVIGAKMNESQRADTLEEALALAAARCGRVIMRTGETSEADLATHEGIASVAVLTGVDEAALIAAYRMLKSLAPRWSANAHPPTVRIAAMGATDEQGRRAFEKIARAARVFLETPLEYAGSVERIEPAPSVSVFRGPTGIDISSAIRALRASTSPHKPSEAFAEAPPLKDESAPRVTEHAPVPHKHPVIEITSQEQESLASRLPGLAPIPFQIPRCACVHLAADASGGLHLLARDDESPSPTSALLSAQAWALLNRDILAAACATILGSAVNAATPATLHLFTPEPKRVRALLDADIRVHFLGSVEMNGKRAWCVAELN